MNKRTLLITISMWGTSCWDTLKLTTRYLLTHSGVQNPDYSIEEEQIDDLNNTQ